MSASKVPDADDDGAVEGGGSDQPDVASQTPLALVLAADAEHVASLLRQKNGDRALRKQARAVLARAFVAAEPAAITTAIHELEQIRRAFGDRALAAVRPLKDVWIRAPFRELVPIPAHVRQNLAHVAELFRRGELPLALSEARVDWMQDRCNVAQPGVVRAIRANDDPAAERLLTSELELLRKKGRSRFS